MNVQLVEDSNFKAQKVTGLGQVVQNIDSRVTEFSGVVNKRLEVKDEVKLSAVIHVSIDKAFDVEVLNSERLVVCSLNLLLIDCSVSDCLAL